MVTIILPPDLEQTITEKAKQQGTSPELLALDELRQLYLPALPASPVAEGQTMADFFAGYIGSINSSDVAPGGSDLSENTGRKFKELLLKKHHEGKL